MLLIQTDIPHVLYWTVLKTIQLCTKIRTINIHCLPFRTHHRTLFQTSNRSPYAKSSFATVSRSPSASDSTVFVDIGAASSLVMSAAVKMFSSSASSDVSSLSSGLSTAPQISLSALKTKTTTSTPLVGEIDHHGGVTVDLSQLSVSVEAGHFSAILQESLSAWKTEGHSAVWLDIPLDHSHLISTAAAEGFRFHHAEGQLCVMKLWMPSDREDRTPQFATHQIGVSGIVIREETKELLLVQDKNRPHTLWKFPGGLSDLGEDIDSTAVREVFEETGVRAEFQSVLAFRQQHVQPGAFGRSDLYVLCRLRPLTFDLRPCTEEINLCRWMTIDELRRQVNKSSLTMRLTDIVQKGLDEGFQAVDIGMEELQSLYRGLTFKLFYRHLGQRYTQR